MPTDRKTAMKLRKEYPNYVPVKVAVVYLGVSARQLSWLVAEGRQPYASIGGNIDCPVERTGRRLLTGEHPAGLFILEEDNEIT